MSTTAFALREDFAGEVEVETEAGEKEKRQVFQGGVLALGEGSIDVGELLKEHDGVLVVEDSQAPLLALLDDYPALKRVAVPDKAKPLSLYATWSRVALVDEARRRGIQNYGRLNNLNLAKALQRQDTIASDPAATREADGAIPEDLEPGTDAIELAQAAIDNEKKKGAGN